MKTQCPWCDKHLTLRKDGRLPRHQDAPGRHHKCTGSLQLPTAYVEPDDYFLRKLVEADAATISSIINRSNRSYLHNLAKGITADHRTLQQATMMLFLECVNLWADDFAQDNFDARNAATCRAAEMIRARLTDEAIFVDGRPYLPYI